MPLWSSYLVKVLSWRTMLSEDGVINWALSPLGLHGPGYGVTAVWLVLSYLWLPYMILPIYAGLERIPDSLISASEDLGAAPVHDLPPGDPAARLPGRRRRLDLHLLALRWATTSPRRWSPTASSSATSISPTITNDLPLRRGPRPGPDRRHDRLPLGRPQARRLRARLMRLSRRATSAAAGRRRDRPRLHLHPADRDRDLRLQLEQDPQMAAARADPRLVREGASKAKPPAKRCVTSVEVGLVGDGDRDRARHPRLPRRRALPLLRPRDGLLPGDPADRPARDRHRRRPQQHLHPGARRQPQPAAP